MQQVPQYVQHRGFINSDFDQEDIIVAATDTANRFILERIDSSLRNEERLVAIQELIDELAEDSGNRYIVEALTQRLLLEKKTLEMQEWEDLHSLHA